MGAAKTFFDYGLSVVQSRWGHKQGLIVAPHFNHRYEILYVLKGSVTFDMEGDRLTLRENSCIVIAPSQHQTLFGNDDIYHRLILFFDAEYVPETIRQKFIERVNRYYVCSSPEIYRLFMKFSRLMDSDESTNGPLLHALAMEIIYCIAMDDNISLQSSCTSKNDELKQLIAYIDANISSDIRMEDIVQHMNMSRTAVYRLFQDRMHTSVKPYVLQKKMSYADRLLRQGVSPSEVAAACGYKNYASFYRVFVKVNGYPPGRRPQQTEPEI